MIGGGDTAMDCISNATARGPERDDARHLRRAARPVRARHRAVARGAAALVTTYALDEGGERRWTQTGGRLEGRDGHVTTVHGVRVGGPAPTYEPIPGSEFELPADLVLVAIGFSHPEHEGPVGRAGARSRPPRQRQGAGVRDLARGCLRRRRRPHRPVADRQRDRRGTPLRERGRPLAGRPPALTQPASHCLTC